MYYNPDDVARLFHTVPCLKLAKPAGALRFLEAAVEAGAELGNILAQYPSVRYEHLDFHYVCLQSLGALNEELLHQLTMFELWPGVLWASLLVALDPHPRFIPILEAARPRAPHQTWLVDLAVAIAAGERSKELPDHQALLAQLAAQLQSLPRPRPRLRVLPPLSVDLKRSARVRAAYLRGGSAAALEVLSKYKPIGD